MFAAEAMAVRARSISPLALFLRRRPRSAWLHVWSPTAPIVASAAGGGASSGSGCRRGRTWPPRGDGGEMARFRAVYGPGPSSKVSATSRPLDAPQKTGMPRPSSRVIARSRCRAMTNAAETGRGAGRRGACGDGGVRCSTTEAVPRPCTARKITAPSRDEYQHGDEHDHRAAEPRPPRAGTPLGRHQDCPVRSPSLRPGHDTTPPVHYAGPPCAGPECVVRRTTCPPLPSVASDG